MPDFGKIKEFVELIDLALKRIFGDQVPPFASKLVGWILLIALALLLVWGFLYVLNKIKKLLKELWSWPRNIEGKRRRERRRRFADHIESEIRRLNNLEAWSDYRFAELEAEVEAEGLRRTFRTLSFLHRKRSGLRRERSLSKALEASQERLIFLEGEPGSGKSVALRYIARSMARSAMKARSAESVIPIYINLKELERRDEEPIDRNLIESFVLKSLNRANDRDIEEFLEKEFGRGLEDGTWLFLFDSFDELPEVLSSTEADETIMDYAGAISDFLHGMNKCRGIVASRQFRGPGMLGWPHFKILPLTEKRRLKLICKADLGPEREKEVIGQLGLSMHAMRAMVRNPMFLGLLCEHIKSGHQFPENVHSVFETYIQTRLDRDEERLQRRFEVGKDDVRTAAESIAFCIAAEPELGLSPTRQSLENAMARVGLQIKGRLGTFLDALEFIKLARSEIGTSVGESKPFTFSHRRFQEFFATCVVLREPDRVSPRQLLTDARWRETAVVICQTQSPEALSHILAEAQRLLNDINDSIPSLVDDPMEYTHESAYTAEGDHEMTQAAEFIKPFPWPPKAIHILNLLQDGFASRLDSLPDDIRMCAARLLVSASKTGMRYDKKCALEVAGVLPSSVLICLLRDAFASGSQLLKEVAYRQVARLGEIPADIASGIRGALLGLTADGDLNRERHATRAHLARLAESHEFLSVLRLLLWFPNIDLSLHFLMFLSILTRFTSGASFIGFGLLIAALFIVSHMGIRLAFRSYRLSIFSPMILFTMGVFTRIIIPILWFTTSFGTPSPLLVRYLIPVYFLAWTPCALLSARIGRWRFTQKVVHIWSVFIVLPGTTISGILSP